MGIRNLFSSPGKGALVGAGIGALGGVLLMGPFGLIPGLMTGAMAGGSAGLFNMNYDQIRQTYNPNQAGYENANYRPRTLFGDPPVTSTVPQHNYSGWGTAAMTGTAAASLAMLGFGCFGMPLFGLGYGAYAMTNMMGMFPPFGLGWGLGFGGLGLGMWW